MEKKREYEQRCESVLQQQDKVIQKWRDECKKCKEYYERELKKAL
jgi:hypothetical protein